MLLNDTTLHPLPANRADDYRYEHSFNWSPKQIQGQAMCHDMPANSKRPITAWPQIYFQQTHRYFNQLQQLKQTQTLGTHHYLSHHARTFKPPAQQQNPYTTPINSLFAFFRPRLHVYKKKLKVHRFVNKSTENFKSSAKNMSSFLKNEVINPWSISRDSIQVIEGEKSLYEYGDLEKCNSVNSLGILGFSVVFRAILNILGDEGKPMTQWFKCLFNVTMKMNDLFNMVSMSV